MLSFRGLSFGKFDKSFVCGLVGLFGVPFLSLVFSCSVFELMKKACELREFGSIGNSFWCLLLN